MNNVTDIGDQAFYNCSNLVNLTSNYATSIGKYAFYNCSNLSNILINAATSIGESSFSGCTSLADLQLPLSLKTIGVGAFYNCTNLISVEIPANVASIGNQAFGYCSNLVNITSTNPSASTLGSSVFNSVASGFKIYVLSNLVSTYQSKWSSYSSYITASPLTYSYNSSAKTATVTECSQSATSVHVPSWISYGGTIYTVTSIGENAIDYVASCAYFTFGSKVRTIGQYGVSENKYNGSRVIFCSGSELTSIANYAFQGTLMYTINLPNSLTLIGEKAFYYCTTLAGIIIPGSVSTVGNSAFEECNALASVAFAAGVKTIGAWSFAHCENLSYIYICGSVTLIGDGAFYGCSLSGYTVNIDATTPPTIGSEVFRDHWHSIGSLKIGVLNTTVQSAYQSAWGEYASYIGLRS